MNEFPTSNTSEHSDGFSLKVAGQRVPIVTQKYQLN